jgi:beta-glucosidase
MLIVLVAVLMLGPLPATAQTDPEHPFRDPDLPLQERIDDLLSRLTLDEKISLLHQWQPAIPRLDIPAFRTGTEALHGVAWLGEATVFPQAVGLASTWNTELIEDVGSVVGDEARGKHVQDPDFRGLNLWAPVVNLLRDPRWGRNEEGYSEDPTLTGAMSTAYAGGMRGDDPTYLKTAPTLKHFAAYNTERNRDTYSASVRPRVLREYDYEAFRPAIEANAATGVMAGYNLINGRPLHVDPALDEVVRSWSDQTLLNVSDAFAPYNLTGSEDYFETQPEANAAILKAGLDSFTVDDSNSQPTLDSLHAALEEGFLTEDVIDDAVSHILSIRFRLGDFDPPGRNPYEAITPDVINAPEHQQLARRTARESMVLLKNDDQTLPLDDAELSDVAVVGPLVDTLYQDWYSGTMPYRITPLDGIRERVGTDAVTASEGVDRIALRDVASGEYITAAAGEDGAPVAVGGTTAGAEQSFDVFDWGEGIVTLRAAANDRYLSFGPDRTLVNNAVQPEGWFVQQQLKLVEQDSGNYVIEYAGNEVDDSWFGDEKYVQVADDGRLTITATSPEEASEFALETLSSGVDQAVAAAGDADVAVVVLGSMPFINGREDDDRTDIALPAAQQALVQAVQAANPNTVVVLETSYPDAITWEQEHVPAILWTTHAGQETGNALADILFGDYNPAGRLTQTWYASADQLPDRLNYDIIKAGWTYMYFDGEPLYPFGYGLSYTDFKYGKLRLNRSSVDQDGGVRVSVDVTNTGSRAGDEVVQLYTHAQRSRVEQPSKRLQAFDRVHIEPGETVTVQLTLDADALRFWDVTRNRWVVESGRYDVMVGASSADIRRATTLRVRGETIPPRNLARATQAEDFDDYSGIELVDVTKEAGTAVGGTTSGEWIQFADVDLSRIGGRLTAGVSKTEAGSATVALRLDDPARGRTIGRLQVPSTGGRYEWTTVKTTVQKVSGTRDLYLVFEGDGVRLDTLRFAG